MHLELAMRPISPPTTILLSILLPVLMSACTSASSSSGKQPLARADAGGGQDTGGGVVLQCTAEEVVKAIKKARDEFLDYSGRFSNLGKLEYGLLTEDSSDTFVRYLRSIWLKMMDSTILEGDEKPTPGSIEIYFQNTQITINDVSDRTYTLEAPFLPGSPGRCPGRDGLDASVSAHNRNASMCFDIRSLRRHAPTTIEKVVFGLMAHEIAHLNEYEETEAQDIQAVVESRYELLTPNAQADTAITLRILRLEEVLGFAREEFQQGRVEVASLRLSNGAKELDMISSAIDDFRNSRNARTELPIAAFPNRYRLRNTSQDIRAMALGTSFQSLARSLIPPRSAQLTNEAIENWFESLSRDLRALSDTLYVSAWELRPAGEADTTP